MGDPRHDLGRRAEMVVATWLERGGWVILARRHRPAAGGEVDLVALDPDDVLVAVEVRARRSNRTGAAALSVDVRRVRRLERTLASFAASSGRPHVGVRVDLVTLEPISGPSPGPWRLRRIPGIGGS
ncbi:MAG: YraN family protein [Candidatus Limnocylindria bacterium]